MKGIDEEWTLEDAELAAYYLEGYLFDANPLILKKVNIIIKAIEAQRRRKKVNKCTWYTLRRSVV